MARKSKESIDDLLTADEAETPDLPAGAETQSAEVRQALAKLKPQLAQAVLNYCAGAPPAEAFLSAGYTGSHKSAGAMMRRYLNENEDVKDAVACIKADMAKRAEYSFEKFMGEMDDAMKFARETENATALVRAIELKGKASGHIVDRVDQRVAGASGFNLVIAGVAPPKVVSEQ